MRTQQLHRLRAELARRERSQGISHDVAKMNRLRQEIASIESKENRMRERLSNGTIPVLTWAFDDQGEWSAASSLKDSDGDALYQYRIQACADGSFDVGGSDPELGLKGHKTFTIFDRAAECCDYREQHIRKGAV
jgi:hypothetical protein